MSEISTLAKTIWGEARGEGFTGMHAVANVIMNRANNPRWWGKNVIEVCLKPYQFSCWNTNDPNYLAIQNVTDSDLNYVLALSIAESAILGTLNDITNSADHYHTKKILPPWATKPVAVIGNHLFYRLEIPCLNSSSNTQKPLSQQSSASVSVGLSPSLNPPRPNWMTRLLRFFRRN